jgi:biotin carboxylase
LLIAATTGYQLRAFTDAAERCGYEVAPATDRCHNLEDPWGDHAIPLRFQHPDRAAEKIELNAGEIHGVVAVGDRPAHIAALAARRLGLPHNPPAAVLACRDKFTARQRFRGAGLLVPWYMPVPLDVGVEPIADGVAYPCVLKPLGLSASRGVIRVDDRAGFAAAFERIRRILETPDIKRLRESQDAFVQIESFIPGREYAVEGLMTRGTFQSLAIFDKPDPLDGPFFEETIYVTPSRAPVEVQRAILATTERAIAALGLEHGPIHAEMRVNEHGVWMLEVAARPIGGLCAQVLRFDDGGTLEEMICRHAAGDAAGSTRLRDGGRAVMMIPIPKRGVYVGVAGVQAAAGVPGVEEIVITAKEGQELVPLPEGAAYLGFIFARGDSPADAEEAVRAAHAELRFEIAQVLPVVK